jgi:tRNA(fMet)-specific endonuclease VapC
MYLFDTSFVIDLLRHEKRALEFAKKADEIAGVKAISVVTYHEVMRGLQFLGDEVKASRGEKALNKFDILPYTIEIAKKASKIDAQLMKSGLTISFLDVVIASTAIFYGLKVVTRDKHFGRIEGLEVVGY